MLLAWSWDDPLNTSHRIVNFCAFYPTLHVELDFFHAITGSHTYKVFYHSHPLTQIGLRPLFPLKISSILQPHSRIYQKKLFNAILTLSLRSGHFVLQISWSIIWRGSSPIWSTHTSGQFVSTEVFTVAHFRQGTLPRRGSLCCSLAVYKEPGSTMFSSIQSKAFHSSRRTHMIPISSLQIWKPQLLL